MAILEPKPLEWESLNNPVLPVDPSGRPSQGLQPRHLPYVRQQQFDSNVGISTSAGTPVNSTVDGSQAPSGGMGGLLIIAAIVLWAMSSEKKGKGLF
jgi:hypothetical protein